MYFLEEPMLISYKRTTISCFVGIFTQAIITNLTAILFIPLMGIYDLTYSQLGVLVSVNFIAQVLADISFSGVIDKVGYRRLVLPTTMTAFIGFIVFAASPLIFKDDVFAGFLIATVIYAFSSGLLEILLSPIISAIPGNDKGPAMSLLHSFYAWGQVITIIITTFFIAIFGGENWQYIVLFWSILPLTNFFMFLGAKFPDIIPEGHRQRIREILLHPFFILTLFAIMFGAAAEVVMNQWSSTFMEKGLALPKLTGDLMGMCGFAIMLGVGRVFYGIYGSKINIHKALIFGSLLAVMSYLTVALSPIISISVAGCILCGFAVSLLWPGTIVISSDRFPMSGAWLFAILAVAGDLGAAFGPWMTGMVIDNSMSSRMVLQLSNMLNVTMEQGAIRFGILLAVIFPLLALTTHYVLYKMKRDNQSL